MGQPFCDEENGTEVALEDIENNEGRSIAPAFVVALQIMRLALDIELLGVQGRVALHQDVFAHQFFKFGEPTGVV